MNLAFIGAGNLAWHLAPELENSGHSVKLICGKSEKNLHALAGRLYDPVIKEDLDFSTEPVQAVFIATPDNVIRDIVSEIVLPDECLLIHCSGTQPMSILELSACPELGVFYPMQTFTRGYRMDLHEVPFFIEANSDDTRDTLVGMANGLSKEVYLLDSDKRKVLHLAATFACNFTNHMLEVARELMEKEKMDFDLLWPILKTTVQKAMQMGPEQAQTGPALRRDYETMDAHLELLKEDPDLEDMYNLISKHIIKKYEEEQ